MIELAIDVEDGDAHDEHRHEHVEQHPRLDQQRGVRRQAHAKSVNAVLQHQKTQHLAHRAFAAYDQKQTGEN